MHFRLISSLTISRGSCHSTLAGAAVFLIAAVAFLRREKFVGRELDPLKRVAWAIGGGFTFFFRCAEIINRYEHCHIADHLYNGEQSERYINRSGFVVGVGAKLSAQAGRHTGWHAAARLTASFRVTHLRGKHNGIHDLHNAFRKIVAGWKIRVVRLVAAEFT